MTTECRRIGERGRLCRTVVISDPHMRLILPLSSKHATVPSMQLLTKVKCHCADLIWRLGGLFEYCFMVFLGIFYGFRFGGCASQSVSQSVSRSVGQPTERSVGESVSQSVSPSSSGSGESVSQSVRLPTEPSISQSVCQSVCQSVNHLVTLVSRAVDLALHLMGYRNRQMRGHV